MSSPGAASAASTDPFVHPALFYRDTEEYLAGTLGFIREGLANGEPVAVAVPGPNLALLRAELGSDAASVHLMDMTVEGRNPGRIIPGVLRAFADEHRSGRVRIIGEPIWAGRSALEYPACVQHEALINAAFTGREVSILCPYDTERLPSAVLADAHATHPVLIDAAGRRTSDHYDPDHIAEFYNRPLPAPPATAATVVFDAMSLAHVRHVATDHARHAGIPEHRLIDVELVIAETTTNSVVHGGGHGTLTMWTDENELRCQISDSGHITNPLAGRLPAQTYRPGGRGLLLVNHLADLVRIHTTQHGTTIQLHFGFGHELP
ncbi:sensor histidine kinase [Nocardia abscessus]|uniref:sensor histidine kinase n=1 Tax=Nocardia TaxID=1817 RepID=UPI0018940243|nr:MULTISPECIES: sensor histidine kinase [Nocardia]MBF6222037.1 sensor histidine kinase [Nocardia abscessus]